eukprot:10765630-Karenia_brevis.AAC.1
MPGAGRFDICDAAAQLPAFVHEMLLKIGRHFDSGGYESAVKQTPILDSKENSSLVLTPPTV